MYVGQRCVPISVQSLVYTSCVTAMAPTELVGETRSASNSPWLRKPLSVVYQHEQGGGACASTTKVDQPYLHRHLSVWDLIGVGVGGTVGSGIFVLTGQIAANYAGRATWLSFAISGMAATCSGVCFAELSSKIPAAGSTYAYAYVCWGQLAAIIAAACLTLEYVIAGAAVARTWGDKVLLFAGPDVAPYWEPWGLNIPAFLISTICTVLLLMGVKESKTATNTITAFKMLLVGFMVAGGLYLYIPPQSSEATSALLQPGMSQKVISGVVRGATSSFFGYLGYDEVCCLAGEAKNPVRDMPRAVLGTLALVTVTYVLASFALTGMVEDPSELSPTSGFPSAFRLRDVQWASEVAAWGEIATLPVVVLISLLAQPRLTYGMAQDGLLPHVFAKMDLDGNLVMGTLIAGVTMTVIATAVPFSFLDDLISAGILVAFSLTDSSLVVLRCKSPPNRPGLLELCLVGYNCSCLITALLATHTDHTMVGHISIAVASICTIGSAVFLCRNCPTTTIFGESIFDWTQSSQNVAHSLPTTGEASFQTPLVPIIPMMGMAINWYMIAQLDIAGLMSLTLYLTTAVGLYLVLGLKHAPSWLQQPNQGPTKRIDRSTYYTVLDVDDTPFSNENGLIIRSQSLSALATSSC